MARELDGPNMGGSGVQSNKGMKLTKLVAAPVRQAEVPPRALRRFAAARTASQLIPGVRLTLVERWAQRDRRKRRRDGSRWFCSYRAGVAIHQGEALELPVCDFIRPLMVQSDHSFLPTTVDFVRTSDLSRVFLAAA